MQPVHDTLRPHRASPGGRPPSAPSVGPGLLRAGAVMAAAILFVGCSGEPSVAQESSSVPSDLDTVRERADRSRVKGDSTAPLQVFEVADFQCQYCARYFQETYPAIDSLYIETGKVRYVFITYPNANHAKAWPAIEAAYCAGAAGKFWQMHDLLFERQDEWVGSPTPARIFEDYAQELDIDTGSFSACVANDRTAPLQVRDLEQVSRAGISSTPFFIINNEVSVQGAVPIDRFRTVLDSALNAVQSGEGQPGGGPGGEGVGQGGGGDEGGGEGG